MYPATQRVAAAVDAPGGTSAEPALCSLTALLHQEYFK
jgi:hypothetical protein